MAASVRALVLVSLASLACLAACHGTASEPAPAASSASAAAAVASSASSTPAATPRAPSGPQTHTIVFADHRHVVPLRVDDRFVIPSDPEIDWRAEFEDKSAFVRVTGVDAGAEVYRITKSGPLRAMFYGDPKCLKVTKPDSPCGLSKRRWDVTFSVQ
jgi:hypothetical protein